MSTENNSLSPLLPDRHPNDAIFICDVADAALKDVMADMEHPFYSLSKKPETALRRDEHNGNWLQITPSVKQQFQIWPSSAGSTELQLRKSGRGGLNFAWSAIRSGQV